MRNLLSLALVLLPFLCSGQSVSIDTLGMSQGFPTVQAKITDKDDLTTIICIHGYNVSGLYPITGIIDVSREETRIQAEFIFWGLVDLTCDENGIEFNQ